MAPESAAGYQNALLHYTLAPLYMQRLQPKGTPGREAQWDGGKVLWPGVNALLDNLQAWDGMAIDFAAVQRLFKPKHTAWKASRASKGADGDGVAPPTITLEHVLKFMGNVMVKPTQKAQ